MMTASRHRPSASGFTLIEVLIAMGIFAVGAIAIAAPLLVAARIQSETIDSILVKQAERNAKAMLRARRLEYEVPETGAPSVVDTFHSTGSDGWDAPIADMTVQPFSRRMLRRWSRRDRIIGGRGAEGEGGRYLWVPMVRSTKRAGSNPGESLVLKDTQWQVYLFVMRIRRSADYGEKTGREWANRGDPAWVPGVTWMPVDVGPGPPYIFRIKGGTSNDADGDGRPDLIRPGDKILDKYGRDYSVVEVLGDELRELRVSAPPSLEAINDPNLVIWYAPPEHATAPSVIRSIWVLDDVVTKVKVEG